MTTLTRRSLIALTAATVLTPRAARAAFPERPIVVVVPYAAGGAGDVIIRLLSEGLEKSSASRW